MSPSSRPLVLCFSGSDSFGAAGAQADLKAIHSHGCHTAQIITAVTAQSPDHCHSVFPVPRQVLADQIAAVKEDPAPSAIKVGMTGSKEALEAIRLSASGFNVPLILDPVMQASSGQQLTGNFGPQEFFSLASAAPLILTPNAPEASALTGLSVRDATDLPQAATAILERGAEAVVIKGGHLADSPHVIDYYADRSGLRFFLRSKRREVARLRGTGCTFASALAARIAQGHATVDAVVLARAYMDQCFVRAFSWGKDTSFIDHQAPVVVQNHLPDVLPHDVIGDIPDLTATHALSPAHRTGFYVIADSADWVEKLVAWDVPTIQLRIKDLPHEALMPEISRAVNAARGSKSALYINDYWREAVSTGAFGVHLGQEDLATADLRLIKESGLRLGLSTHSWYEAAVAATCRPSYIALGPVFPTTCKSMRFGPQGLSRLMQWKQAWDIPLVAIGGLTLGHASDLRDLDCDGAAVISDVLRHPQPEARARAWTEYFPRAWTEHFPNRQDF
jgi:hydroxymethylpyrimidine kinase/phosphomethylpyrimidine kinase/thiamine-phosphate diphosphorylase